MTYWDLAREVRRCANALKALGIRRGDGRQLLRAAREEPAGERQGHVQRVAGGAERHPYVAQLRELDLARAWYSHSPVLLSSGFAATSLPWAM